MIPEHLLMKLTSENRKLVENLTEEEIIVIKALSKPKIMKKDNFREETIRKHLPPLRKDINVSAVSKSLNKKGIFALKRARNWKFTGTGLKIAQFFKEVRFCESGKGLSRILKHGIIL